MRGKVGVQGQFLWMAVAWRLGGDGAPWGKEQLTFLDGKGGSRLVPFATEGLVGKNGYVLTKAIGLSRLEAEFPRLGTTQVVKLSSCGGVYNIPTLLLLCQGEVSG